MMIKLLLSMTSLFVMRDMFLYLPIWARLWIVLMMSVLFVAPMFFFEHTAAQWMIATFMLGGVIMGVMHLKMGMTKLMGIAHIPWIIPLYYIFQDLSAGEASYNYQIWLMTAAIASIACLLIDVVDVTLYLSGKNRLQIAPPAPV
jgi:hypothetical protein